MANVGYLSRQALATLNAQPANSGTVFPVANVSGFTQITGIASIVGSASIRMRFALNQAGPFIVSSVWNVNSGVSTFIAPNFASWCAIDITACASQVGNFAIYGEPTR